MNERELSEAGSPGRSWIAVLPADTPERELEALTAGCVARGWSAAASRGEEQTVVAVAGPSATAELLDTLPPGLEADLEPLHEADHDRVRRSQRRFLNLLGWGLGLISAAILLAPLLDYLRPLEGGGRAEGSVRLEGAAGLQVGEARVVRAGDERVLVVRSAPERWHALPVWCTHDEGCTLVWNEEQRELSCPCHGCAFDPAGNVLRPPALFPLARRGVRAQHGKVVLEREGS